MQREVAEGIRHPAGNEGDAPLGENDDGEGSVGGSSSIDIRHSATWREVGSRG